MTAARQERKSPRSGNELSAIFAAAALLAAVIVAAPGVGATASERVIANRHTGLAIDGVDPVAYFTDAAPEPGRPELELQSGGATWRFRNAGNRAAFAADPAVYAPRFGGHDPVAVARGIARPGNPDFWLIEGERLYLFYDGTARADFAADPGRMIEAAERHWPDVRRTLVP